MSVTITETQRKQFIIMYNALKTIGYQYQTPDRLRKESKNDFGLDYTEALEMSYENIQQLAKASTKGIRKLPY